MPYVADYIRSEGGRALGRHATGCNRHNVDRIERWERGGAAILERIASEEVSARRGAARHAATTSTPTVDAVEDAGVQPVYSLKVETDDHSFLTNGFVSHNTEARLSRLATEMLRDIDADTVDFGPNYDESRQEPLVLPSRFPNLLVNGAAGHRGRAWPPTSRRTTCARRSTPWSPTSTTRRSTSAGLMKHIKGPDFPTGGIIVGRGGHPRGLRDRPRPRGRARQGAHRADGARQGAHHRHRDALPGRQGRRPRRRRGLIKKIAEQVQNGRIKEISDLRDESDRSGIRLVIELKRDALPKVALNKLYKHTPLQTTFGVNMVALVDGVPRTLGLLPIVKNYVDHQRDVIVRRTKHELREREARAAHPRGAARSRSPTSTR